MVGLPNASSFTGMWTQSLFFFSQRHCFQTAELRLARRYCGTASATASIWFLSPCVRKIMIKVWLPLIVTSCWMQNLSLWVALRTAFGLHPQPGRSRDDKNGPRCISAWRAASRLGLLGQRGGCIIKWFPSAAACQLGSIVQSQWWSEGGKRRRIKWQSCKNCDSYGHMLGFPRVSRSVKGKK